MSKFIRFDRNAASIRILVWKRRGGHVNLEIRHFQLRDGDRLLLCTDGLTDMVPQVRIGETLLASPHPQQACDNLVAMALEAGGKDNVTVLAANYSCPANP